MRSTAEWFSAWLDETLGGYRWPQGEGATPRYSVVVGKRTQDPRSGTRARGLHILYRGTAAVVRTRDIRTLARSLLADLPASGLAHRNDAIYLSAGAIAGDGAAAIVPGYFLTRLARLRRRAQMARVLLPGTITVALDRSGNRLVPVPGLAIPSGAFDRLVSMDDDADPRDERAFIDRPVPVGAVLTLGPSEISGLSPIARSLALYRWGARIVNLSAVGGSALESLGRLVAEVPTLQVGWQDPVGWLGPLGELLADPRGRARSAVERGTRSAVWEIRA